MTDRLGKEIICLSTKIKREIHNLDTIKNSSEISGTNGLIIGFLYSKKDIDIYQKDIEKEFGFTRSTASNIISRMEELGYIKRISNNDDLRLKKLVLTEKGINHQAAVIKDLNELELKISNSFTSNEAEEFIRLIKKLECVLDGDDND